LEDLQRDECLDVLFAVGLVRALSIGWMLACAVLGQAGAASNAAAVASACTCQNPTLDVLESKLRQLKLHNRSTFTWGELTHVW
jgi:hypothetical protein